METKHNTEHCCKITPCECGGNIHKIDVADYTCSKCGDNYKRMAAIRTESYITYVEQEGKILRLEKLVRELAKGAGMGAEELLNAMLEAL